MNPSVNMLGPKKIRLHGMSTTRWTTKDKIFQYKGLINLYNRDKKIMTMDLDVAQRKQYKELRATQIQIADDRAQLMDYVNGSQQSLRNILAGHRELQLSLDGKEPTVMIERLDQTAFSKRKELDKLTYTLKLKSKKLVDLKLRQAILEDNITYSIFEQSKEEQLAEVISGQVQDAILRKEAAMAIRNIYNQIIDIMKKDALYYDAILVTIRNDGYMQSKCLINATELGQLATEYLDDRQQEYATLEKIVIKDMKIRQKDLAEIQKRLDETVSTIRGLLRRDDDFNFCFIKLAKTPSDINLENNVAHLNSTLNYLKETTLVESFEAIYPCLEIQILQQKRLYMLALKIEKSRDVILNKLDHAELMEDVLRNTMVETTRSYREKREEFKKQIEEERKKQLALEDLIKFRKNLTAKIRIGLAQIQQLLSPIKIGEKKKEKLHPGQIEKPEYEEIDGVKIVNVLMNKVGPLLAASSEVLDLNQRDYAHKVYADFIIKRTLTVERRLAVEEEGGLQVAFEEISHVLTHRDVKKLSDSILAEFTKSDD